MYSPQTSKDWIKLQEQNHNIVLKKLFIQVENAWMNLFKSKTNTIMSDKEIEGKINRVLEGSDPNEELDGPTVLLVSYKKDAENLYKTLKSNGLRPVYKYSNTSARTPFYFNSLNPAEDLKTAYKLALDLGIKCELI